MTLAELAALNVVMVIADGKVVLNLPPYEQCTLAQHERIAITVTAIAQAVQAVTGSKKPVRQ